MATNPSPQTTVDTLLLAYLCVKDAKSLRDKVRILDQFGFTGVQIAQVCNCTEKDVSSARYHMKREAAARKGRTRKIEGK